jgi:TPR repeat protein
LFRNTKYKDIPKGLELAFKAANSGDEESQNALGLCYEEGIGVEINNEEAFKWYSLAVKNGAGPCALHNLARCYREGKGVAIDKRKANYLDKQAEKLGYK